MHSVSSRMAAMGISMLIVLAACSGNSEPSVQGGGGTTASQTATASANDGGGGAANAAVPTECSELKTDAVAELLGGKPVLDDDSNFEETLEQLHCIWNTSEAVPEDVSVQLAAAGDFIGFYASQEGTGISDYTEVEGFDEGRLYGEFILIAKRNGLAVVVDARLVSPEPTEEQIVAVALEATTP